jgi:hypothetical protein
MAKTKDATAEDAPPDEAVDESTPAEESPTDDDVFLQEQEAAAAAQSPAEPQVVPEVRPQAAVTPAPGQGVSEASKRIDTAAPAMGQEAYDRANSDEAKAAATEASRMPNLTEGQRVVITGDNPEAGRMAYIQSIAYKDGIQDMVAHSGTGEARFADVDHYVIRTRDGRSDLLVVPPDQVTPLEDNEGWGRGQI